MTTTATPNPALVAAAPTLEAALTDIKQFLDTILTGDPMKIPLRVGPAFLVLSGQLQLLAPELLTAEEGVVLMQASSGLDGLISKLKGIQQQGQASATPSTAG
jgi:hypothetical protein